MGEGTQINIKEWGQSSNIELTSEDIRYIQEDINEGIPNKKIEIIPLTQGQFNIRSNNLVGAFKLPSGKTFYIEPKIFGLNFLRILASVLGKRELSYYDQIYAKPGDLLPDMLGRIYMNELVDLLNRGLFKSYRTSEEELGFVKGRILVEKGLGCWNHFQIFCETDDLTSNCPENRSLLFSAYILRNFVRDPDLMRELGDIASAFLAENVESAPVTASDIGLIPISRVNDHYEPALNLCKFIVENTWVERFDEKGGVPVRGMLIDMNKLFEDFVTKLLKEAYHDYEVLPQDRVGDLLTKPKTLQNLTLTQDYIPNVTLRPDCVISTGTRTSLVVDAKYKQRPSNDDIYQALSYALALDAPSILVLPQDEHEIFGCYVVPNVSSRLFVITLDFRRNGGDYFSALKNELRSKLGQIIRSQVSMAY
ncbi:MAG: hypothetical protein FJ358_07805 [Thaumarchaeota archaeon]|nr:hypothetical protein [Nitrososphaerota archaeon]